MSKILVILGTRPQYIKFKPLYDHFKFNEISFYLADTSQHYSYNLSGEFIKEFDFNVDRFLNVPNTSQTEFIGNCITKAAELIEDVDPSVVLVIGDTNSTLAAALAANKVGKPVAHLEAGIRCGNRIRPEEINRIITDDIADLHFVARSADVKNVRKPIIVGDMEYVLLHQLEADGKIGISRGDFILMTIHRAENTNPETLSKLFECFTCDKKIVFPAHPRTVKVISENNIKIPNNIEITEPVGYFKMVELMSKCGGIISDSGGIIKTAPFYGKRCIIPGITEWSDVITLGYGTKKLDINWLNSAITRGQELYYRDNACGLITEALLGV